MSQIRFQVVTMLILAFTLFQIQAERTPDRVAKDYFETYRARLEFDRFMEFYAEDAVLEDVVYGNRREGRSSIRSFFNWPNPQFKLGPSKACMTVESMVVDRLHVVARGYFHPFTFNGVAFGPWHFVTWLEFDDEIKIQRQIDFINYPDTLLQDRKDANLWIEIHAN